MMQVYLICVRCLNAKRDTLDIVENEKACPDGRVLIPYRFPRLKMPRAK